MKAMKQKKNFDREIRRFREDILKEIAHWKKIKTKGCNDPYWPDGCNMNLTRNHVISDKRRLRELCEETGAEFPDEYYLSTPPKVDDGYMANLKQEQRVEKLKSQGCRLSRTAPEYDSTQMNLEDLLLFGKE